MSYETFLTAIRVFEKRSGVRVRSHRNGGAYYAFGQGVRLTGNSVCKKITVRWGSGHTAMFEVPSQSANPENRFRVSRPPVGFCVGVGHLMYPVKTMSVTA